MEAILYTLCRIAIFVILSAITLIVIPACQKVINVDLNEAAPKIVIEGVISDRRGPYTVTISKSGSFFNQPALIKVTDAVVVVQDNVSIDTLKETTPGNYVTKSTRGIPGRTYNLKVFSGNTQYTATSTMLNHVNIDSLTLVKSTSGRFDFGGNTGNDRRYEIHCFFRDPPEKNFYRLKVFRNDSINTENYRLYDDQYTNGMLVELRATNVSVGSSYRIELWSIDKATYQYFRMLEDLINANPLFGSTPANPDTNLSNGALGYFGACAVSSKTVVITNSMVQSLK